MSILKDIVRYDNDGLIPSSNMSAFMPTRQSNKYRLLKNVVDNIEIYLACAEPLKALFYIENCVPAAVENEPYLLDIKKSLIENTKHARSFEEFKAFYKSFASAHGGALKDQNLLNLNRYSKVVSLLDETVKDVLNIGCGDGTFDDALLAMFPEINLTIADISETDHVNKALTDKYKDRVSFHKTENDLYDWPNKEYDCVLLCEVIEHVPNPVEFLSNLKKRLKPGGSLILTTPDAEYWIEFGKKPEQYQHLVAHGPLGMAKTVAAAGLDIKKLTVSAEQHIILKAVKI